MSRFTFGAWRCCPRVTRSRWKTSGTRVVHRVHLLENLKLDELAMKKAYEFAFIMQPLEMEGATGSTVAPVAVR